MASYMNNLKLPNRKETTEILTYGKNKYYYSIIIAILLLIMGVFYYLNEIQNIFKIKNTKYEIFMWLFLVAFSIYTFLSYVYKHNYNNYNTIKPDTSFINMYKYVGLLFLIILFPILTINFIVYLHKTNNNVFNITQNILGILIIIVIFAIIAKIFPIQLGIEKSKSGDLSNSTFFQSAITLLKDIIDIIFFIPCLLIILVDEINEDIKLTPSSIYLLFFILLILITLIFVLPLVFNYLAKHNKNNLLGGEGPFYLNEKKTLGKYQNLDKNVSSNVAIPNFNSSNLENTSVNNDLNNMLSNFRSNFATTQISSSENSSNEDVVKNEYNNIKNNVSDNTKGYDFKMFKNNLNDQYNIGAKYYNSSKIHNKFPYNYTYSISFYIYINPQPTNTSIAYTKDTELFNYGFKPVIYYNGNSRKIIIKSRTINNKSDQLDTIYEMTSVKHQKWLYFVINYENNNIDVFIDGKLVGSKNNVTPYFIGDTVTIGQQDGIHGSIKEIFYFDKIKTPDSIQFLYSLTKNNNI